MKDVLDSIITMFVIKQEIANIKPVIVTKASTEQCVKAWVKFEFVSYIKIINELIRDLDLT